jgi:hypothetical protein
MDNLITTINDIDVFVDQKGKFYATVDGKKASRTTLASIQKLIEEQEAPLVAYELDMDYRGIARTRKRLITGFKDGRPRDKHNGLMKRWDFVYVCNDSDLAELQEIADEQTKLSERWNAKKESLTQVKESNFKALRQPAPHPTSSAAELAKMREQEQP